MKNNNLFVLFSVFGLSLLVSSCSVVGGIFKLGMGFGIFLVVLVILVIGFLVVRLGKKQ